MRWTTRCTAACWLIAASGCTAPPREIAPAAEPLPVLAKAPGTASATCLSCHPSAAGALSGPMSTRDAERAFCRRAFGAADGERFFASACTGCHVSSCADCHGETGHPASRPPDEACQRCHRGYFVGWDYAGRAPREDHPRYRRGPEADGEH